MDERAFPYKAGQPIPAWDLLHRLPTMAPVGPDCQDTATLFRMNSTFMDVTDQPYMIRQMLAGGVLVAIYGVCTYLRLGFHLSSLERDHLAAGLVNVWLLLFVAVTTFAYLGIKFGRDEFFALKRRPIRFNRKEQKIYTIRRRRFFSKPGEGDVTWEVPWNAQSIFCIHKSNKSRDNAYHIRHYEVDDNGNVVRAFAIGRQWDGRENVQGLLAQWNYWCAYMNHGPENLPSPPLFFSENEDARESFLFCRYSFGFQTTSFTRTLLMPLIVPLTAFRLIALWTCRDPIWPEAVQAVSAIAAGDRYDEPRGRTAIGWAETGVSAECDEWPFAPSAATTHWQGEMDAATNAGIWTKDTAPAALPPSRQPV